METYGKILLIAMPAFLLLVLFEKWYGVKKGFDTVRNLDMISSLSSGVTNVTKDVIGIGITILSYDWLVKRVTIYQIENTILTYIVAFIAIDFLGYWVHRISHKVNFFWNYHVIHHSSEEFNLACALRQSISGFINIFSFFLLPAAVLGVPTQVIAVVAPIQLFAQFWYHTRHIDKMGWLENVIVTPSHHRVHHAINKEYMDKNLSQIFIIWDKLFGTFQKELADVPPTYGITRPARTWNPIKINFQHLWLMMQDAWRTNRFIDKFRIWFMPTGWRPKDVEQRFEVIKIENPLEFEKYDTPYTKSMSVFYWFQLTVLLLLISYFFGNIATFSLNQMLLYGFIVFIHVYSFTELMDLSKESIVAEFLKLIIALGFIFASGDWFGIGKISYIFPVLITFYFVASFIFTLHFYKQQQLLYKEATQPI